MVSIIFKVIVLITIVCGVWARPRRNVDVKIVNLDRINGNALDIAIHQPSPNQFPTVRKDPPVTRSCKTRGSRGNTNEEECNIAQEERCNKEDEEDAGCQLATDMETNAGEDGKECYFKHERLNPDGLEKNERPDHSKVSTKCKGKLRSFEELADSQPLINLQGAENNADLALIRGAAEFENDFDDEAVKERMKNIFICKHHEDELVYHWKTSKKPKHVIYKEVNTVSKVACSVPNAVLNMHGLNSPSVFAKPGRFLRKKQAEAFLKQTGTHLQVGIAMCQAHAEQIDRWQTMNALEKDGLEVTPNVNYAGTASLDQSIAGYSERHERVLEEMDCRRDNNGVWTNGISKKLQLIMDEVAERYAESAEWPARRTLLALVAPILSFAELEKFIPGLTYYSDAVMIGLPYGSISAKISSGKRTEIASTLRLHRNEHITQMYERYLDGVYGVGHEKGISRSTMWKILDVCSAHRKKAITGLDEFIANGRDGFDHIYQMLQSMLDQGHEDRDFVEMATKRLKESHQYLEGDYKLHVAETSTVADHCIRLASHRAIAWPLS
uniref:Uncharacterized protein n=1 Tax=Plectus sambesii TaxID=2011161 RepID=A0A914XLB9_9BILA